MIKYIKFKVLIGSIISMILLFTSGCKKEDPASACADGVQNEAEVGVDCGGDCTPCSVVGVWKGTEAGQDFYISFQSDNQARLFLAYEYNMLHTWDQFSVTTGNSYSVSNDSVFYSSGFSNNFDTLIVDGDFLLRNGAPIYSRTSVSQDPILAKLDQATILPSGLLESATTTLAADFLDMSYSEALDQVVIVKEDNFHFAQFNASSLLPSGADVMVQNAFHGWHYEHPDLNTLLKVFYVDDTQTRLKGYLTTFLSAELFAGMVSVSQDAMTGHFWILNKDLRTIYELSEDGQTIINQYPFSTSTFPFTLSAITVHNGNVYLATSAGVSIFSISPFEWEGNYVLDNNLAINVQGITDDESNIYVYAERITGNNAILWKMEMP